jgi:hypothetical protein
MAYSYWLGQNASVNRFVILAGLLASIAHAGTIQVVAVPTNTAFGTHNGFWTATVNGVPGQLLASDDYNHTAFVSPDGLPYLVSMLTGDNRLQYARFFDPERVDSSILLYEQAGLLLDGMRQTGPGSLFDLTAQYQYALWRLFTRGIPLPDTTVETLLAETRTAVEAPDAAHIDLYSSLRILTPLQGDESSQEFLAFSNDPSWLNVAQPGPFSGLAPPSVQDLATPEPAAIILAATGLGLILAGPLIRRLGHQAAASSNTRTISR